jgi:TRAP-type C4-dicarboxylate transport system permease small subunit
MSGWATVLDFIRRIEEAASLAALGLMVLVVCIQVFFRYALASPLAWAEELAMILLIWIVFLGAGAFFIRRRHIQVDFFVDLLPPLGRKVFAIVANLLVAAFLVVLAKETWNFMMMQAAVRTTVLQLSSVYLILPVLLSAGSMLLAALHFVVVEVGNLRGDRHRRGGSMETNNSSGTVF